MLSYVQKLLAPKRDTSCGDCAAREAAARPAATGGKYTLLNAAADTLRGDFATEEVRQARIDTCKKCEYLAMGSNCKLCGCFVHIKARYAGASCDINKW